MTKQIDYQKLLDNALKSVVKDALVHAQFNGLGDGARFFITFKTRDPGVVLPDFLRIRYPDIMTIVLQYSYNNLNVSDKEFGVQLTFDGRPFFIRVPFASLIEFKDPSVDFMLSFQAKEAPSADNDMELPLEEKPQTTPDDKKVVSLDDFRKRKVDIKKIKK
ncbi:MAG: ClpXP protease specificity-enhancing factor SspB [Rickettsiales bacterium]|nr:ClpXP protease specificity-enhancing factor SspB [Rickettsiales bacterium]